MYGGDHNPVSQQGVMQVNGGFIMISFVFSCFLQGLVIKYETDLTIVIHNTHFICLPC